MQSTQARRWDPLVRLTHWGVAAGIVANGAFTEEGSGLHLWVGYGVGALLALRLLWGVIGPPEARFSAFPSRRRSWCPQRLSRELPPDGSGTLSGGLWPGRSWPQAHEQPMHSHDTT